MQLQSLARGIVGGERRALARGLTLVESALPEHEELSLELFSLLGPAKRAFRLGITGPPGAGKSTLIEKLVMSWVGTGERVAVLTVDPSSGKTGGSLLGDKTRMGELSSHPQVFVRPSPSSGWLGGLGRRSPLMCALLERAGYQRIVMETVGVGQSEVGVRYLVDQLLLVALPGAGDELQGLKRGLMEEVDLIAVNKADLGTTRATVAQLRSALRVFRKDVPVCPVSALTGEGMAELLSAIKPDCPTQTSARNEARLLEDYSLDLLRRALQINPEWLALRRSVENGERDFLEVLKPLKAILEKAVVHHSEELR